MRNILRKNLLENRSKISKQFIKQASNLIATKIINLPEFRTSSRLACYLPVRSEVDTEMIIEAIWEKNKYCYLPALGTEKDDHLCFIKYDQKTLLAQNKFSILEPLYNKDQVIKSDLLDIVIMPLVGFDENCNRIGYGGGYYDRTFAFKALQHLSVSKKPLLIGIAYELQKIAPFIPEKWDIPLYKIITEKNIYSIIKSL